MKSFDDFQKLFTTQLSSQLLTLEVERKQVMKAFWPIVIFSLMIVAVVIFAIAMQNNWLMLIGIIPLIFLIRSGIKFNKLSIAYRTNFKEHIIRKMISFIDEQLNYEPKGFLSLSEFYGTKIFHQTADRYKGDDLVDGKLGATALKFSEVHAEYKQVSYDSKGRRHETWVTIFKGILFKADFNKNFKGNTIVLPDTLQWMGGLGTWFQKMNWNKGDLVKLENVTFEKYFAVYSNDQVEARYILSSTLMERIIKFREQFGKGLYMSFVDSCVNIALPISANLFEPKIFSSAMKTDYLQQYFNYLALVAGIVDELNLNMRIWTKQ